MLQYLRRSFFLSDDHVYHLARYTSPFPDYPIIRLSVSVHYYSWFDRLGLVPRRVSLSGLCCGGEYHPCKTNVEWQLAVVLPYYLTLSIDRRRITRWREAHVFRGCRMFLLQDDG